VLPWRDPRMSLRSRSSSRARKGGCTSRRARRRARRSAASGATSIGSASTTASARAASPSRRASRQRVRCCYNLQWHTGYAALTYATPGIKGLNGLSFVITEKGSTANHNPTALQTAAANGLDVGHKRVYGLTQVITAVVPVDKHFSGTFTYFNGAYDFFDAEPFRIASTSSTLRRMTSWRRRSRSTAAGRTSGSSIRVRRSVPGTSSSSSTFIRPEVPLRSQQNHRAARARLIRYLAVYFSDVRSAAGRIR